MAQMVTSPVQLPCVGNTTSNSDFLHVYTAKFFLLTITIGLLNFVIVFGNVLVILAVLTYSKLRTVTNIFIGSLAFADLCVGLLVLPFSNANQVMPWWIFGSVWCSMWLAVDVWLCTASILNLCAISLDRYIAISQPLKYPSLMSALRAKVLVGLTWFISFLICLPPIVGWNNAGVILGSQTGNTDADSGDKTQPWGFNGTAVPAVNNQTATAPVPCFNTAHHEPRCELVDAVGYRIYSAVGSFYLPMFIMGFFYWRIYRTAVQTTQNIRRGTTSAGSSQTVTLRIHRGGSTAAACKFENVKGTRTPLASSSHSPNTPSPYSYERSNCDRQRLLNRGYGGTDAGGVEERRRHSENPDTSRSCRRSGTPPVLLSNRRRSLGDGFSEETQPLNENHNVVKIEQQQNQLDTLVAIEACSTGGMATSRKASARSPENGSVAWPSTSRDRSRGSLGVTGATRKSKEFVSAARSDSSGVGRSMSSCNEKRLRSLNKETKAAKTVGIIVGCFILCWLPFFSVYLLGAFYKGVPIAVVDVAFWLGYCNSALNPCIYAFFSRDFRRAFQRLLCRCCCSRRHHTALTGASAHRSRAFVNVNNVRVQISSNNSSESQ